MLFNLDEYRFYLCPGAFDMRIGIWRLLEYMDSKNYDAHDKVAYMVCGKSRKCIKIVLWNNGWAAAEACGKRFFLLAEG